MALTFSFFDNDEPLVFFDTGPYFINFGVDTESNGPCIVEINIDWLESGAASIESVDDSVLVFSTGNAQTDLSDAHRVLRSEWRLPELPEVPSGRGIYLLTKARQCNLLLKLDSKHDFITSCCPGVIVSSSVNGRYLNYVDSLNPPRAWVAGNPGFVTFRVGGALAIYNKAFAIDVGTTNTCAAFMAGDSQEPTLFNFEGAKSIPTLVKYRAIDESSDRAYSIGVETDRREQVGGKLIRGAKRYMGLDPARHMMYTGLFDAQRKPIRLRPDQVYQDFVRRFMSMFQQQSKVRIRRAKATFPPGASPQALEAVRGVYEALDIDTRNLLDIDEGSAAGLYFVWKRLKQCDFNIDRYCALYKNRSNMLVFDFGGGTTDAALVETSVLRIDGPTRVEHQIVFSVLGATSEMYTGGDNFTLATLIAIRNRLALAGAIHNKGVIEGLDKRAAEALKELYDNRTNFEDILANPIDPSEFEVAHGRLDRLSAEVIPTKSVAKFVNNDVFAAREAQETFDVLWPVAERIKIEVCKNGRAVLPTADFEGTPAKAVKRLRLPPSLKPPIELRADLDIYPRIQPLIERALRAGRSIITGPGRSTHQVDSIQLVGNSSKIRLIRDLVAKSFSDIPQVNQIIEEAGADAKSSVAMGACLAFHWNSFGGKAGRLTVKVLGRRDELGWEIGLWDEDYREFTTMFSPWDRPADRPHFDVPDAQQAEVLVYRRRLTSDLEAVPTLFGKFVLTAGGEPNMERDPAPPGFIRVILTGANSMQAQRGTSLHGFRPLKQDIDVKADPFSGEH